MTRFRSIVVFALIFSVSISCNTYYQPQSIQYRDYRITPTQTKDEAIVKMLLPYSDSVGARMNEVIGFISDSLTKQPQGGSLGNFMADAYYTMAGKKISEPIDIAFMNVGGIRIPRLQAGNITRGRMYELMPFDNEFVIQRVKGTVLKEFLDLIGTYGGWPVAGMTMDIKNKQAVNILIGGKPLDTAHVYTILNSDFVAGGGDKADMLKLIPIEKPFVYLLRDAIIDYIKYCNKNGIKIIGDTKVRVKNAN